MAFWNRKKKEPSAHPTDTRLEIVSDGLTKASSELQDFVSLLRQKYQYAPPSSPNPLSTVKEGGNDGTS